MTEPSIAPAHPLRTVFGAALVASLAIALVAGSAAPARAAEDVRLTQPGSGARVDGPTTVRVEVDSRPLGEVQWVEARLRRDGEIVGPAARLVHQDGDRGGGTSTWTGQWDPGSGWIEGGRALANGTYEVEARAHSEVGLGGGETTDWRGHSVTVSQSAVAPELTAEVGGDGRLVRLQWSEATTSDFVRYELERAGDGGGFQPVTRISQRGDTIYRDEPPTGGTWRYRVTAVRDDGSGGESSATSDAVTVETGDDDGPSPTPTPGGSTPTPSPDGSDGDGDGGSGDGDGGSGDGDGEASSSGSSGGVAGEPDVGEGEGPSSRDGSVPDLDAGDAEAQDPVAGEPEDDFSTELDYGDPDFDRDSEGGELAEADGPQSPGVLAVGDQEFALERVLPPMAGGLLLFVTAGHVLRLRQQLG